MTLPQDFDTTLEKIEQFGILNESTDQIYARLGGALSEVLPPGDLTLGPAEWLADQLEDCTKKIHTEICDTTSGTLKQSYINLLDMAQSKEGVATIAATITGLLGPVLAVSSVLIYLSLWILKVGLDQWCKLPQFVNDKAG